MWDFVEPRDASGKRFTEPNSHPLRHLHIEHINSSVMSL